MTREEAKEILTHNWTRVDNPNYSESELDEAFFMAIEALSAEARPTGEWIFNTSTSNGKSWNVCSECGDSIFHPANFCPNCGAMMTPYKGGDSDD